MTFINARMRRNGSMNNTVISHAETAYQGYAIGYFESRGKANDVKLGYTRGYNSNRMVIDTIKFEDGESSIVGNHILPSLVRNDKVWNALLSSRVIRPLIRFAHDNRYDIELGIAPYTRVLTTREGGSTKVSLLKRLIDREAQAMRLSGIKVTLRKDEYL